MRLKPKPIKSIPGSYPLRVSGIMSGGSKELVSDVPGGRHFLKDLEEEDGYRGKFKRRRFSIATSVRPSSPFDKPSSDWNDTENESNLLAFCGIGAHADVVSGVKFSPNGHWLASCSHDKSIKILGAYNGRVNRSMTGHGKAVLGLAWSPDSRFLISVSDDVKLKMWSLATGKCLKNFEGHVGSVFCCDYGPDSSTIASGGLDSTVRLWNARKGILMLTFPEETPSWPMSSVNFSADGSLLLTSNYSNFCRLLDTRSGRSVRKLRDGSDTWICHAAFTPNGKYVLASRMDGTIRLYDLGTAKCVKTYTGHVNRSHGLPAEIYPAGNKWIVSGSENHLVYIWDVQTRRIVQTLSGHTDVVTATACHPTANIIASASRDTTVRLYMGEQDCILHHSQS